MHILVTNDDGVHAPGLLALAETMRQCGDVSIARLIVHTLMETGLPKGVFLNVNVPNIPTEQLRGIRNTRQGLRVYRDHLEKRQDPRGRDHYWIGGDTPTGIAEEGTDVGALAKNFASVTPLQLDLTAYPALSNLVNWQWNFAKELW